MFLLAGSLFAARAIGYKKTLIIRIFIISLCGGDQSVDDNHLINSEKYLLT